MKSRDNALVSVGEERLEGAQLAVVDVRAHSVRHSEDNHISQHLQRKHYINTSVHSNRKSFCYDIFHCR